MWIISVRYHILLRGKISLTSCKYVYVQLYKSCILIILIVRICCTYSVRSIEIFAILSSLLNCSTKLLSVYRFIYHPTTMKNIRTLLVLHRFMRKSNSWIQNVKNHKKCCAYTYILLYFFYFLVSLYILISCELVN